MTAAGRGASKSLPHLHYLDQIAPDDLRVRRTPAALSLSDSGALRTQPVCPPLVALRMLQWLLGFPGILLLSWEHWGIVTIHLPLPLHTRNIVSTRERGILAFLGLRLATHIILLRHRGKGKIHWSVERKSTSSGPLIRHSAN